MNAKQKCSAMNWNDLSYLLAVLRGGSLLRAARLKGVDKSTVSRRLAVLEADLGMVLVERSRDGQIMLTDAGRDVAGRAEAVEDITRGITAGPDGAHGPQGRVRLTAVPLVINHLLVPKVAGLTANAPGLSIELIADAHDMNLTDRDADMAVRLARPREGGQSVLTWRVGVLEYGCYAAIGTECGQLPWIGYEPRMAYLSQAMAIEALGAPKGQTISSIRVNDAQTLLQVLKAGLGQSLLPRSVGQSQPELIEIEMPGCPMPSREMWLLVRRDIRHLERVAAVVNWVEATLGR